MACRVGITTDPAARKAYWESQHPNLSGWTILGWYPTKQQAQNREDSYARAHGCVAHAGGPDVAGPWAVYTFNY
jgi:hypothetical protein